MVSLLDIGLLNGGNTSNIVMLGDGFTELTEDWGVNSEQKQYIHQKSASNTIKGYALSFDLSREYMSDEVQTVVDEMFKDLPTGTACNTYYYRFYKTDITGGTGDCIRVPVTVAPKSTGGAGGDTLVSALQVNGNGDAEKGTVTITENGYTWTKAGA